MARARRKRARDSSQSSDDEQSSKRQKQDDIQDELDPSQIWMFDCVLNQTDLTRNSNKFYKIRIEQISGSYHLYTSWGRVGEDGRCGRKPAKSFARAVELFETQFKAKTGNEWSNRHSFVKKSQKYMIVKLAENESVEEKVEENVQETVVPKIPESTLHESVQELLHFLSDEDYINATMQEFNLDREKLPLGSIDKKQIELGREILEKLSSKVNDPDSIDDSLTELTNEFYSIVPHSFGRKRPPVISSIRIIRSKMEMLDSLADMSDAADVIKHQKQNVGAHPLDSIYGDLNTKITPVDEDSDIYQTIKSMVKNTHGETHHQYRLKIRHVYEIERPQEKDAFESWKDCTNRQLLWHGSRSCNWISILQNGLRINPSGVIKTGSMFGEGVYLANSVSKSANYCHAKNSDNKGVLMLGEAALGKTYNTGYAEWITKEILDKKGFDSTWGTGRMTPDPKCEQVLENGCKVQTGKLKPSGQLMTTLEYDEFVIYQTSQLLSKYLVFVDFIKSH